MNRKRLIIGAAVVVVAAAAVAIWFATRPPPVSAKMPAAAPAVGTCWSVDSATAQGTLPWSGGAVSCSAAHTAEIILTGQVDRTLVRQSRSGDTDQAKVARSLMYGLARRSCGQAASTYLGGSWHSDQVTVLASWIAPARDGFYGCALAQTSDPGGKALVSRSSSLKGVGSALAIECVTRGTGDALGYSTCEQPHDGEFVGTFTVTPPNALFDRNSLGGAVAKGCDSVATSYLGASRTDLSVGYVGPTSASTWLGSDQTFACYAMAQVKLRGTLRSLGTRPLPH
ncbi:MAG TPA: septum formation family protein [Rugosimonospora sp.]|nr:septum formation family protein [Rugosimonospora sp.]